MALNFSSGSTTKEIMSIVVEADSEQLKALSKELTKTERLEKAQANAIRHLEKRGVALSGEMKTLKTKLEQSGHSFKKFNATAKAGNASLVKLAAGAAGAVAGFMAIKKAMGDVVTNGLNFQDWVGGSTKSLQEMSQAVDGIIGVFGLRKFQMALADGGFQLTQKQMEASAKAAVIWARRMGSDATKGLERLKMALLSGMPTRILRQLGDNIQLTGTQSEKTAQAIEILEARFGGMTVKVANANEGLATVGSAWEEMTALAGKELAPAIQQLTKELRPMMYDLQPALVGAGKAMGQLFVKTVKWVSEWNKLDRTSLLWKILGPATGGPGSASGVKSEAERIAANLDRQLNPERFKMSAKFLKELATVGEKATQAVSYQPPRERLIGYNKPGKKGKGGGSKKGEDQGLVALAQSQETLNKLYKQSAQLRTAVASHEQSAAARTITALSGETQAVLSQVDAYNTKVKAQKKSIDASVEGYDQTLRMSQMVSEASKGVQVFATGSLASMAGGLWSVADAAIASGQGVGAALAQMTKSTLLGIAQQATVKAIFNVAEGLAAATNPFTAWMAPGYFASAKMFGVAAATAGAGGLGLSLAGVGGSGGGGAGGYSPRGASSSFNSGSTKNSGSSEEQVYNTHVYGDTPSTKQNQMTSYQPTAFMKDQQPAINVEVHITSDNSLLRNAKWREVTKYTPGRQ